MTILHRSAERNPDLVGLCIASFSALFSRAVEVSDLSRVQREHLQSVAEIFYGFLRA